jgi:Zn2+/Cd2+-exporting ATPase
MLEGIGRGSCAAKIERESSNLTGVRSVVVDFISLRIIIEIDYPSQTDSIIEKVKEILDRIEPGMKDIETVAKNKTSKAERHEHSEAHDDEHEQDHDHEHEEGSKKEIIKFVTAAAVFGLAALVEFTNTEELILYLISY